jgi:hypothetical protein
VRTLYLSDLDGTLLRSNERLSDYTVGVINKLVKDGGCFSYASARSFVTASKVTAGLAVEIPVICYNGAFIIENGTGNILRSNYLPKETAEYIQQILTEYGVNPIVYSFIDGTERFSYINPTDNPGMRFFLDSRGGDKRRREVNGLETLFQGTMFNIICIGDKAKLAPINGIFKDDKRVQCVFSKEMYSGAWFLELYPEKATKANAALQLKQMLGCDRIIAFGDGVNDLSLFNIADESYAMGNAEPELKEIATAIIGTNDEDGVAKWLFENVLR